MASFDSVAVIGAGQWGTALAGVAARAGRAVTLYARNATRAAQIEATRENPKLAGVQLAPDIAVTHDLALAAGADILLIATPRARRRSRRHARTPSWPASSWRRTSRSRTISRSLLARTSSSSQRPRKTCARP